MDSRLYVRSIRHHYSYCWSNKPTAHKWNKGPIHELPPEFEVLRFPPTRVRSMWTYATCGMSMSMDDEPLEIHVFSPEKHDSLIELLTVITHYHRKGSGLGLGHTVNFGQGWLPNSTCEYGLLSLPYLDYPSLEWLTSKGISTRFLWLIPITKNEVKFKKQNGLDALEEQFEHTSFNYLDPYRKSVV